MSVRVNQAASGLDIFLRDPCTSQLTDPSSISYVIQPPPSFPTVASGAGFKIGVGHYDARNSVIPSGYSTSADWKIVWTYTSPDSVTSTATQEFTVSTSLSFAFSAIENIVDFVELDLGLSNTDFTAAQLEAFVKKALNRLNRRLQLTGTSEELSISSTSGLVIPTPDTTVLDLIIMQTECIIAKQLWRVAGGKGIKIKDGETSIDTSASLTSGGLPAVTMSFCSELDDAIKEVKVQRSASGGQVITYANTRIQETLGHSGQGDGRQRTRVSPFEVNIDGGHY